MKAAVSGREQYSGAWRRLPPGATTSNGTSAPSVASEASWKAASSANAASAACSWRLRMASGSSRRAPFLLHARRVAGRPGRLRPLRSFRGPTSCMAAPRCGGRSSHAEHRTKLMSRRLYVALALAALIVVLPAHAQASSPTGGTTYTSTGSPHGGTAAQAQASPEAPVPTATTPPPPTAVATVGPDGLAVAPAGAPAQVAAIVA